MDKDNGSLLIIVSSLYCGGEEKQYRYVIDSLANEEKSIVVLMLNHPMKSAEEANRLFIESHTNVEFIQLNGDAINSVSNGGIAVKAAKIKNVLSLYFFLKKYLKHNNVDRVMFSHVIPLLMVPLFSKYGVKTIFNERNTGRQVCDRKFKIKLLERCHKVVANSSFAANYIENRTGKSVEVFNNGIEISTIERKPHENFNIVVPARIIPIKNQLVVLKAINNLEERNGIKLIFAGAVRDRSYFQQLERYVEEHDIMDSVSFLGHVDVMERIYETADMVVLPSYEEGTPNVLLEAYMYQIPILVSNIPMNKSCALNDDILFHPDDDLELAHKIEQFVIGSAKVDSNEMAQRFRYVEENYEMAKLKQNYKNLLISGGGYRKKIDVITIHRNCNYGSVLQTYATQIIFQDLGFRCEVIDYIRNQDTKRGALNRLKNKSRRLASNPVLLAAAKAAILPSYIKKEKVFNAFLKRYVRFSEKSYHSEEELISNPPVADAYCTGSDQIWNSYWNEGIEKAYYLDFVVDNQFRFSYSSSIGKDEIEDSEATEIKPLLERYQFLSVREGKSVETLQKIGFADVRQVLDPTLYKDSEFWNGLTTDESVRKPYVLTYNLHHDKKLDRYAQELASTKGLTVINISYNWHDVIRKGKLAWCPAVETYLGLIRSAQYVVADSFHATAFSIQFHKKFVTFYPEQASIRMRDLLSVVGLSSHGVDEMPPVDLIDQAIDYEAVDKILDRLRNEDRKFLLLVSEAIKEYTL